MLPYLTKFKNIKDIPTLPIFEISKEDEQLHEKVIVLDDLSKKNINGFNKHT